MPTPVPSRFWSRLRIYFRRFRIAVLLSVLALVGAGLYLNRVGLPGALQRPLLNELRARGVDLEFARLRWHWYRGLVADHVRFGRAQEDTLVRVTARQAELQLSLPDLLHGKLTVAAVGIRQGEVNWVIPDPPGPARALTISDIEARLRLPPGDEWLLEDFRARWAGADFYLNARVTNASHLAGWKRLPRQAPPARGTLARGLRTVIETLEQIAFATPPELRLSVEGDARDLQTFSARLMVNAPAATTEWGDLTGARLTGRMRAAESNRLATAEFHLVAAHARTPWVELEGFDATLEIATLAARADALAAELVLRAAAANTPWATATNVEFTADWAHALAHPVPLNGRLTFCAEQVVTPWAGAAAVQATAQLGRADQPPPFVGEVAWWNYFQPYELAWNVQARALATPQVEAATLGASGYWRTPQLAVTNFQVMFSDGGLAGDARLQVDTRMADFRVRSDFDVHQLAPLLSPKAAAWLDRYQWAQPPRVSGHGAVRLPPWTDRQPDWRADVLPSLRLAGAVAITNGAHRGVAVDWATLSVSYTNMVWLLPDLVAGRPEGQLHLYHRADDRTRDYYFRLRSTFAPQALRPALDPPAQRGLDQFTINDPPQITGEIWGRWRARERTGFRGHVAATNFSVRGQSVSTAEADVVYTNQVLSFLQPRVTRGDGERGAADGVTVDLNTQRIHFTNAFGNLDPQVVAQVIGPRTAEEMADYRFHTPPQVRVEGYAPLHGGLDADLRFAVDGGAFSWWRLNVPRITGQVHWHTNWLGLTNVSASFYGGEATGHALFDLRPESGTEFGFRMDASRADLKWLMADLATRSSNLEGSLSGWLEITNARAADSNSWFGATHLRLRDGLIWEVPIFGALTQPLQTMVGLTPGRASEGFVRGYITNSVLYAEQLELRAPALRIQYRGTVDWDGNVNARAEAEPLRDTWVIGPVLSLALKPVTKMFEFKVTGTLEQPKVEPLYVPKLLLLPLRPFRTLEELFLPQDNPVPPVFKEVE